jgi:nucleoside-diphosphate-sugar epimerase
VSDTRGFTAATGWAPQVTPRDGVGRLRDWLRCSGVLPRVSEAV